MVGAPMLRHNECKEAMNVREPNSWLTVGAGGFAANTLELSAVNLLSEALVS